MSPLFGSFNDGHARTHLRVGLAVIVGVELLAEAAQVATQAQDPRHYAPRGALALALGHAPWLAWFLFAMIALGLVAFARDRRPVASAIWALAWAGLLSAWQTELVGSPSRNAFFPGAALMGWMLGELWATRTIGGAPRALRDQLGEAGALGCLAAAYVGSCASKLLAGGASWLAGMPVRALVLRQQPLASWSWLLDYRDAVIDDPALARAAAVATLVIEGGAFALLLGPRLRLLWAALLVGLHANILLLCTMPYLEPVALLLLFAPPWPQLLRRRGVRIEHAAPRMPRALVIVLLSIAAIAWLAAPWGWRDEHRDHPVERR